MRASGTGVKHAVIGEEIRPLIELAAVKMETVIRDRFVDRIFFFENGCHNDSLLNEKE